MKTAKNHPGGGCYNPIWLIVGTLAAFSRAFLGVLVCLYHQGETARKTALAASWRLYMKKPGFDPRFSVFLAALLALCGPF